MKPSYGMTSQEAAALYLSGGHTTDPELASMLDYAKKQPELLIPKGTIPMTDYEPAKLIIDDPEDNERIRLRNQIGFDVTVLVTSKQATLKDTEHKLATRCYLTGDAEVDGQSMSQAMLRLKAKYRRYVNTIRPVYD